MKPAAHIVSVFASLLLLGVFPAYPLTAAARPQQTSRSAGLEGHLVKEVRHELVTLPYYSVFDNLSYGVQGDKVILTGQVTDPSLKSNAEKAVKGIEGVQSVDNQIEVLPLSTMDDQIRLAEYRAIYSYGPFQRYSNLNLAPMHIIVKGGHVTLEGTVVNQRDKDAATIRANTVDGVFSVTNNLRVDTGE